MAVVTLTFSKKINESVQVGDLGYFVDTSISAGGFNLNAGNITFLGLITDIENNTVPYGISFETTPGPAYPIGSSPTAGAFIMFAKDQYINNSGVKGYYAEVKFSHGDSAGNLDSSKKIELFSVETNFSESSK